MKSQLPVLFSAVSTLLFASFTRAQPFELKDGDRVVFLGSTLIEREQRYGYWETMFHLRYPDKNITFRNLGWSGDTVRGESRAFFGTAADGFKHLVDHVHGLKPTVLFIGYGTNESFEGEAGLPRFKDDLEKLLAAVRPTGARIVLMSPARRDDSDRAPRDAREHNQRVELYRDTLRAVATNYGYPVVDFFELLSNGRRNLSTKAPRESALHWSRCGYWRSTFALAEGLGLETPTLLESLEKLKPSNGNPDSKLEKLRLAIIEKNLLYFYRWRPQNETYLFGFRKHEQGQNAREIPEFDPLVAGKEQEIEALKKSQFTKQPQP